MISRVRDRFFLFPEFSIYVFTNMGVYSYDAQNNRLTWHMDGDYRKMTGKQDYPREASVNLVYVGDMTKLSKVEKTEDKNFYMAIDCGFICQNVYLYCASVDLGCVVRASVDKTELSKLLKLNENQQIVISQSVGYKK